MDFINKNLFRKGKENDGNVDRIPRELYDVDFALVTIKKKYQVLVAQASLLVAML